MRVLTMIISALALFASVASAAPMPQHARQLVARQHQIPPPPVHVSGPEAGTYVISNAANGPNGEKLAITYNSEGTVTVTRAASGNLAQRWIIVDDTGGQSLKPVSAPSLEAAWGGNTVSMVPSKGLVWTMKQAGNRYSIQDGKGTVYWGLKSAADGSKVTIGAGTGDNKQTWLFEKVG